MFNDPAYGAAVDPPVDKPVDPRVDGKPGVDPGWTGRTNRNGFAARAGTEGPKPLLGDRSAGTAKIGNSGAATYGIPIVVPPGINGVAPKLTFVYNSQFQENGIVGIHWRLEGLPTIERCPQTVEQDGSRGGINYDADDRFCLDGARLMAVTSGAYGAHGMQYRTEVDSGVKVISYGTSGSGPSYFAAQTKAGDVMEFGNTADSKIERAGSGQPSVRVWALNKFTDSSGNYFTASYTEDNANGDYRPSRIDYTGNAAAGFAPNRSVQFGYESRTDSYPMYVGGSVIQNLQLLNSVKTYVGSTLVKEYRLVFSSGTFTGRSRLNSITECAGDGSCLPANTFGWQEGGPNFSPASQWLQHGNSFIPGQAQYADLNGDGKTDLIFQSEDNQFWVSLSTGAGLNPPVSWMQHGGTFLDGQAQYADLNGDGKADLIFQSTVNQFWVSLSTGTGFNPPAQWLQHGATFIDGQVQYADLNGDGRADLIYQATDNKFWVSLSTGTGFSPAQSWLQHGNTFIAGQAQYADLNGDGKADLIYQGNNNQFWVSLSSGSGFSPAGSWLQHGGQFIAGQAQYADLNGDGKADLILQGNDNKFWVSLSTGAGFTAPLSWFQHGGTFVAGQARYVDLNGDGKADLIFQNANNQFWVTRSTGAGFVAATMWMQHGGTFVARQAQYADLNGDGLVDLVFQNNENDFWVSLVAGPFPDLVNSIGNGFGGTSTITYKSITDTAVYTKHSSAVYPNQDFQQPLYVVSNLSISDGMPGNPPYLYAYKYEGGKFHHQGRGWLGFRTMATDDQDVNTRTVTYLNQYGELNHAGQTNSSFALTGSVDQIEVERATDSKVFSLVRNFYATPAPYTNYPGVKLVNLTRVENFVCEGVDTTCTSSFQKIARNMEYTAYGNLKRTYSEGDVVAGNDERDEKTDWNDDVSGFDPINGNWIQQPIRIHTYNPSTGNSLLRERWLTYDNQPWGTVGSAGLLTKVEDRLGGNQGNANNPVTIYKYEDGFGNRTSVIDPRNCETKTVYEATYRTYPESVTACFNLTSPKFTTTYLYNERYGTIKQQTDPNGAIASWTYDGFGRLEKMIGPLDAGSPWGTFTKFYVSWGVPGQQSVNTYRTEQHGTGNVLWTNEYIDGLGRAVSRLQEGPDSSTSGKYIFTQQWYDSRNMVTDKWVPFFVNSSGSPLETPKSTTLNYDPLGRLTLVTNPDSTWVSNAYSAPGVITITNERGKTKKKYLDPYGQLTRVDEFNGTDPNYITQYFYDAAGSLTLAVNSLGHRTSITYDYLGRKALMCDPNMGASPSASSCPPGTPGAWTYGYNLAGDLTTQVDARGQQLDFTYDELGRLKTKKQGATSIATWTYDNAAVPFSKGRVTKVVDRPASTNLTTDFLSYDAMGRVLQTKRTYNNSGQQYTLTQTYDALSRITSETFSDEPSNPFLYSYNEAGWLSAVSSQSSGNFINNITYNARGQKKTVVYPNGQTTEFTYYDPVDLPGAPSDFRLQNRTTSRPSGVVQNLSYTYQPNGNVQTITEAQWSWSKTFYYDDLDRIQGVPSCANTIYDKIGNILDRDCNGQTLQYNDANHPSAATFQVGTNRSYAYDLNGNMTNRNGVNLCWDIDNRLITVGVSPCPGASGVNDTYHYDFTGMRVRKNAGTVTLFPFSGYDVSSAGVVTKYIRIGNEIYASKIGATKYFYHNDHLGGVNVITDAAGDINQRTEYGTWGAVTYSSGNVDPLHRFTGQELDPETGLYYYGGRYYDSDLGRFISPDPFVQEPDNPQSLNRYSYTMNNPQRYIDPSGYFWGDYDEDDDDWAHPGIGNSNTTISLTRCAYCGETSFSGSSQVGGDFGYPWYSNTWFSSGSSRSSSSSSSLGWTGYVVEAATYLPGPIGSAATLVDAGISFVSGNYVAAGVSVVAAAAPLVGVPSKAITAPVKAATAAKGLTNFSHAAQFGVQPYNALKSVIKESGVTGLQKHHLIEQRFSKLFRGDESMLKLSIALTPAEHQLFTNSWRRAFSYGTGTASATREEVLNEARKIYADYPEILNRLGLK